MNDELCPRCGAYWTCDCGIEYHADNAVYTIPARAREVIRENTRLMMEYNTPPSFDDLASDAMRHLANKDLGSLFGVQIEDVTES